MSPPRFILAPAGTQVNDPINAGYIVPARSVRRSRAIKQARSAHGMHLFEHMPERSGYIRVHTHAGVQTDTHKSKAEAALHRTANHYVGHPLKKEIV